MEHLALMFGIIMGSLYDPVFWLMLGAAAACGLLPGWPAVAASVFAGIAMTSVRLDMIDSNRDAVGMDRFPWPAHLAIATFFLFIFAAATVYGIRRMMWRKLAGSL